MAFVYITFKNKKEAREITGYLLKKRLIACSNIFPIESMYWWKGKVVDDKEYATICKTRKEKIKQIEKEVKKMHSYEVPCICMLEAKANKDYACWVKKEVR